MSEQIKNILIVFLIIGILGIGIYVAYLQKENKKVEIIEVEKNVPLLDAQIFDWAINIDDNSKMFFDYKLYNYGNQEGKNIKVRCKLFDENNNVKVSVLDSYGNVASNSVEFEEVTTSNFVHNKDDLFSSSCYVESCDNCEILYKKIPELVENFEK